MTTRYVRTEPIDALEVDGESLLLLPPDQVVRLSPIGSAIVAAVAGPTPLDVIAEVVEERFGAPDGMDALVAVREFCEALARAGVLEQATDG